METKTVTAAEIISPEIQTPAISPPIETPTPIIPAKAELINPPENPAGNSVPEFKRGRGRPPGSKTKRPELFNDLPPPDGAPPPAPEKPPIDYKATAEILGNTTVATMTMCFGPEWQWRDETEKNVMLGGLENYLKASKVPDVPPGVMLLLLGLMYAGPRLQHPNTMGKIRGFVIWVKEKFRRKKTHLAPVVPMPEQKT